MKKRIVHTADLFVVKGLGVLYRLYMLVKTIWSFLKKVVFYLTLPFVFAYKKLLFKPLSQIHIRQIPDISYVMYVCYTSDEIKMLGKTLKSLREQKHKRVKINLVCTSGSLDENSLQLIDRLASIYRLNVCHLNITPNEDYISVINENISINQEYDYAIVLDCGDCFEIGILRRVASYIAAQEVMCDMIYLDELRIENSSNRPTPLYKSDWNPDTFLSKNYLGNAVFFSTTKLKELGYFRAKYPHAFLYDFALRLAEKSERISHIAEPLFIKKNIAAEFDKTHLEEMEAIKEALKRQNILATVDLKNSDNSTYAINYSIVEESKVSIIIPSRNQAKILNVCLDSIHKLTTYGNYEIIIIDNGSDEKEFFDTVRKWKGVFEDKLIVKTLDIPFNYSKLNNYAASISKGEYLLFLNNDIEIITPNWIEGMLSHAQRESVGTVGVKLLYPNNKVQHAGVVLGVDGIASHSFINMTEQQSTTSYLLDVVTNYSVLTAACLMVKKTIFDEIGGFDEKYKVEFNDYDLCLRIKELGYHNVYTPEVKLYHYESYSRGANKFKSFKSMMQYKKEKKNFLSSWKHYVNNDPCYNPNLSKMSKTIFEPK